MGRTVPSFRIALYQEEKKWRKFRATLDKKDKAIFDDMFATARLYISACMMSCRPIRLEAIFMSIIFHHFKQIL
ncbi:MAG: hypothetical protein R3237_02250, partial [Nitrosopumilaceae archaeon]|nr:hypothetical protein [Nitrosopumilaceae archaeon]